MLLQLNPKNNNISWFICEFSHIVVAWLVDNLALLKKLVFDEKLLQKMGKTVIQRSQKVRFLILQQTLLVMLASKGM